MALPPVKDRVRISARVSSELAAALELEMMGRMEQGRGRASLAAFVQDAVHRLAGLDDGQLHRAYRRALPAVDAPQRIHLQPRVSRDAAAFLGMASSLLKVSFYERSATRRALLITAMCEHLDRPGGAGNPHLVEVRQQGNIAYR